MAREKNVKIVKGQRLKRTPAPGEKTDPLFNHFPNAIIEVLSVDKSAVQYRVVSGVLRGTEMSSPKRHFVEKYFRAA